MATNHIFTHDVIGSLTSMGFILDVEAAEVDMVFCSLVEAEHVCLSAGASGMHALNVYMNTVSNGTTYED